VELKRRREDIPKEWKKEIRREQRAKLRKSDKMHQIANKCHWLGWGEIDGRQNTILRFCEYWASEELDSSLEGIANGEVFAKEAFSPLGKVGVPLGELRIYLRYLLAATQEASSANFKTDSFALLCCSWSEEGGVRWRWSSVDSLCQEFESPDRERLKRERSRTKDWGPDIDHRRPHDRDEPRHQTPDR
jgi:hypothetical protein